MIFGTDICYWNVNPFVSVIADSEKEDAQGYLIKYPRCSFARFNGREKSKELQQHHVDKALIGRWLWQMTLASIVKHLDDTCMSIVLLS